MEDVKQFVEVLVATGLAFLAGHYFVSVVFKNERAALITGGVFAVVTLLVGLAVI